MLIRTIGIFIVMGIITIIASRLSGITVLDIVLLAAMISPLALLQKNLHEEKKILVTRALSSLENIAGYFVYSH